MKPPNIPDGAKVAFTQPPQLWSLHFTDFFSLNYLMDKEEAEDMVLEIVDATAGSFFDYRTEERVLFTSDQVVVDLLTEKLYGREIAFVHIHIPNPHNDEF